MKRVWCAVLISWLVSTQAYAQSDTEEDIIQAVTVDLQQETGVSPSSEAIVDALNRLIVSLYQQGQYAQALSIAKQTYPFALQELGPEHPQTLSSVNN
ncbi:MAG: tetratricopeptide repeat protein, partial [Candidatus Competibacteraceae bacterium]|nr:tetratricopeptide repeat protein [Candidatus Competibacteraceae bacterium]